MLVSKWTEPHKVQGSSGSHRRGGPSLIFRAFSTQPGLPRKGGGPAPHRPSPPATRGLGLQPFDHSCSISSSPEPPSLQAAGFRLIKIRKISFSTCLSLSFCKRCTLPPSQPPCIHSFLILHSPFLSCLIPTSDPLMALGPLPQYSSHGLPPRSQPISGPWFWGSSWVISDFCPGINEPLSYPLISDSRDCCFKIPL